MIGQFGNNRIGLTTGGVNTCVACLRLIGLTSHKCPEPDKTLTESPAQVNVGLFQPPPGERDGGW